MKDTELSKFLSLVLRHKPEIIGIRLDSHGYADIGELLNGMNRCGKKMDKERLERIVAEDNKKRYSFDICMTKIRANQGHSIPVDVELREQVPPEYLSLVQ